MNKTELFRMSNAFSAETVIYGYTFGSGEKAAAIIGSMRGNEYQQLYICSRLSKRLSELEESGNIVNGKKILLIPTLNHAAHNINHKHWPADDSDINRQFPGNPKGTATSRIAYQIQKILSGYSYAVQFPSFYKDVECIPHVKMMKTGHESLNLANLFGLPFIVTSDVRSFDSTTLNYNLQVNGTDAFSIYSGGTDIINEEYAELAVSAVLRFLSRMGIIRYNCQGGYMSTVIDEENLISIKADDSGFVKNIVNVNDEVKKGQELAELLDPMDGHTRSTVRAPFDGIIFYRNNGAIIFQNMVVFNMIKKLHK